MLVAAPERNETAEYYHGYIDEAGQGNIMELMRNQREEVARFLGGISEERSLHRYNPEKWSIAQVLSHINDTERVFAFRALWFARGFDSPLPSFDQEIAVAASGAEARSWTSQVDEFRVVRGSTLALLESLPTDAWMRRGVASGNPFTVRALAYIIVGHVNHHLRVLRERYL